MRLLVVVAPGRGLDPAALVPGGRLAQPQVSRPGLPPQAALLGLLGQDLDEAWTGPAAFAAAAAGLDLVREEETAYLLDLVRVEGERIASEPLPWGPVRQGEILGRLAEVLDPEPLQVAAGQPPVLVLGEPCAGPPVACAGPLSGRALDDLPAGPPALLARVVAAGRQACAECGRLDHVVFPHAPAPPGEVTPLRQAWLGLGPSVVVGSRPEAAALARLLSLSHVPARAGAELEQARAEAELQDLVLVVCERPPAELGDWGSAALAVAGDAGADGVCALAWRGGELGQGPLLLGALLEGSA